jgi:hypothetical protein
MNNIQATCCFTGWLTVQPIQVYAGGKPIAVVHKKTRPVGGYVTAPGILLRRIPSHTCQKKPLNFRPHPYIAEP